MLPTPSPSHVPLAGLTSGSYLGTEQDGSGRPGDVWMTENGQ